MSLTSEQLRELLIDKFMGPQETLLSETQSVETPSLEPQSVETPSLEPQSVETPSLETQSVETPSLEPQSIETPSLEPQSIETPSLEPPAIEQPAVYKTLKSLDIETALPQPQSVFDTSKPEQTYTETTSSYYYLDDDPLSRVFRQNRDYNKEYKIKIVLYRVNDSLAVPFLEFYFEKIEKLYQFPEKILNNDEFHKVISSENKIMPTNEEATIMFGGDGSAASDDEDDINEIEEEFLNQCSRFLQEKTGIESSDIYKGFLENSLGEIFVFYDFTDVEFSNGIWGILDEIINKHRIADTGIQESNYRLFYENQNIIYIKNEERQKIEIPISGYLCIPGDKNAFITNESPDPSISLIVEKIDHPIFKKIYVFSYEPIDYENLDSIKRYAIFIKGAVYLLNNDFELTPEMNIEILDTPTVSFYKNGKLFWGVKNNDNFAEL